MRSFASLLSNISVFVAWYRANIDSKEFVIRLGSKHSGLVGSVRYCWECGPPELSHQVSQCIAAVHA